MDKWNFASVAVALLILGIFTSVVKKLLWNYIHGKSGCACGGDCSSCSHCAKK